MQAAGREGAQPAWAVIAAMGATVPHQGDSIITGFRDSVTSIFKVTFLFSKFLGNLLLTVSCGGFKQTSLLASSQHYLFSLDQHPCRTVHVGCSVHTHSCTHVLTTSAVVYPDHVIRRTLCRSPHAMLHCLHTAVSVTMLTKAIPV